MAMKLISRDIKRWDLQPFDQSKERPPNNVENNKEKLLNPYDGLLPRSPSNNSDFNGNVLRGPDLWNLGLKPVQEAVTSRTTHLTRTSIALIFYHPKGVSHCPPPCWFGSVNNHTCRKMSALAIMSASVDPCTCGIAAALGLRTQYTVRI